jgi:ATP-binding cassette subfamily B protein
MAWAIATAGMELVNVIDPLLHHFQEALLPLRRTERWLHHLAKQPFCEFLSEAARNNRDLAETAITGIAGVYTRLADQANSLGVVIGFTVLLWSIHPLLVLVATLSFVLLGLKHWRHGQTLYNVSIDEIPHHRQAGYLESVMLNRRSIAEVRIFHLGPYFIRRWLREVNRAERLVTSLAIQNAKHTIFPLIIAIVGMVGNLLIIIWLGSQRLISSAEMVTAAIAVWQLWLSCSSIASNLSTLRQTLLQISGYHDAVPRGIESQHTDQPLLPERITLQDVWYRYPGMSDYALRGVTCSIHHGEHIAVVGKNGSGKTTLILVLLGLLKPERGVVYYDDHPIDEGYAGVWSVVSQDFVRYPLTVRENVIFGDDALGIIAGQLRTKRLLDVWDLPAGKEFVNGIDLSQGEWQRLAIARALQSLEKENRWFAFDEASAWMDPLSELEVQIELDEALHEHTAIFISHRMGFARRAPRILVFDDGQIIQDGSHEQLVNSPGLYNELFKAQASAYSLGGVS